MLSVLCSSFQALWLLDPSHQHFAHTQPQAAQARSSQPRGHEAGKHGNTDGERLRYSRKADLKRAQKYMSASSPQNRVTGEYAHHKLGNHRSLPFLRIRQNHSTGMKRLLVKLVDDSTNTGYEQQRFFLGAS